MNSSSRPSAFAELKSQLERIASKAGTDRYFVPSLWTPVGTGVSDAAKPKGVNQAQWLLEHLRAIEHAKDARLDPTRSLNGQIPGVRKSSW